MSKTLSISQPTNSRYRPEIDGLRAFAVTSVIINHFNKDFLPGGYLGVDIFFVISGFVITSSLQQRPSNDFIDFISGFYVRRIKRLIPALSFFVLVASVTICLFNVTPEISLKTGFASLFGLSNLYLYERSTDYFAQAAELNVFTHTWSLGVEEQFYFLFPFIVWFSGFGRQSQNGERNLSFIVGIFTIASLVVFIYLYLLNQPAAYFLMPSRFWEMSSGCLLFIGLQKRLPIFRICKYMPSSLGLFLIIVLMLLPNSMAIFSTIGVVLLSSMLIISLTNDSLIRNFFCHQAVVYIGLISYSLYLWHWGILSISRWTIGIHWWTLPIQIALILLFAISSYKWIELPFRKIEWFGKRWLTLISGAGVVVTTASFLFLLIKLPRSILYAGNFREAIRDDYSEYFQATRKKCAADTYTESICKVSSVGGVDQSILLYGDSHAGHLIPLMGDMYAKSRVGVNVSTSGPFPTVISSDNRGSTFDSSIKKINLSVNIFDQFVRSMKSGDLVILSSRWESRLHEDSFDLEYKTLRKKFYTSNGQQIDHLGVMSLFESKLKKVANDLRSKGINLVIFSPIPVFRGHENPMPHEACNKEWFRPFVSNKCVANYQETKHNIFARNKYILSSLNKIALQHSNVFLYNPFDILCPGESICKTSINGKLLFRDDDHLSRFGAKYLLDDFLKYLSSNNLLGYD